MTRRFLALVSRRSVTLRLLAAFAIVGAALWVLNVSGPYGWSKPDEWGYDHIIYPPGLLGVRWGHPVYGVMGAALLVAAALGAVALAVWTWRRLLPLAIWLQLAALVSAFWGVVMLAFHWAGCGLVLLFVGMLAGFAAYHLGRRPQP